MPEIKFKKLRPNAQIPARQSASASGYDLYAAFPDTWEAKDANGVSRFILSAGPYIIPTGLAMEFPEGLDVQIRGRSGLSSKGIMVALGTVDADYRGELGVMMYNVNGAAVEIKEGDRIAQLVFTRQAHVIIMERDSLDETERGANGFGSTGT